VIVIVVLAGTTGTWQVTRPADCEHVPEPALLTTEMPVSPFSWSLNVAGLPAPLLATTVYVTDPPIATLPADADTVTESGAVASALVAPSNPKMNVNDSDAASTDMQRPIRLVPTPLTPRYPGFIKRDGGRLYSCATVDASVIFLTHVSRLALRFEAGD
jgi:hypothetical protein